MKRGNFK